MKIMTKQELIKKIEKVMKSTKTYVYKDRVHFIKSDGIYDIHLTVDKNRFFICAFDGEETVGNGLTKEETKLIIQLMELLEKDDWPCENCKLGGDVSLVMGCKCGRHQRLII